ncbi:MAG: uridine kinase [Lachnospiraceae bacterium]|nr:uridine kinase [Lachnospiraceae bacterium]
MKKVIVIGVAGGSASGKTTIAYKLKEAFAEDVELISHDCYYRPHDDLTYEERTKLNYDHPSAFDTELMIQHIKALKRGETICRPVYNYVVHNRSKEIVLVHPAKVIIIEGFMIFENKELRDMMDIKLFVDTDADIRLVRRILRDVQERGRSLESVLNQYQNTVKPMHEQFVEPSKRYADVIIPEGGHNEVAMSMLMEKIKSILGEE